MKSFATAVGFLTIFPIPENWSKNTASCSVYFALTGALIGVVYRLFAAAPGFGKLSTDWKALLLLLLMVVITRGLHLDGLADMADGFFGGAGREKILLIMKDSATGVFGMLALFFILFMKWLSLKSLFQEDLLWVLIIASTISRFTMTLLSGLFDYARKEGTGHSVVTNSSIRHAYISLAYAAGFLVLYRGFGMLVFLLAGSLVSLTIGYFSNKKISGITGDILGASSEISEMVVLAIAPAILSLLPSQMWNSPWI